MQLPTGTITFLFSDMEGSSIKWEQQPETMGRDLALHDRLLRQAFEDSDGFIFKTVGDERSSMPTQADEQITRSHENTVHRHAGENQLSQLHRDA